MPTSPRRANSDNGFDRTTSARTFFCITFGIGGGNSVIPDQDVLFEALGRIPADETFAVAVGEPQQGWTDLTATYAETFLRYFLLPRRVDPEARWIICFACDRQAIPGARAVWEGEDGIAIRRRQP